MISQADSKALPFGDWADVISSYAAVLVSIEAKLSSDEIADLIASGAQFYRTLARAEEYRRFLR
ncbi:hypothetical protein L514_1622 [Bordetella bronchiseptica MBORD635]|nr:hypothetical protein L514_1622 [Bordetella bronchiseptica MBORD635]KDD24458.1 hypothetical protein L526_1725 [Bordetella bronchiseptica MBORD785]